MSLIIGLFIEVPVADMTSIGLLPCMSSCVSVKSPSSWKWLGAIHTTKLPFASCTPHITPYTWSRFPAGVTHCPYFQVTPSTADRSPKDTSPHVLAPPTARRPPAHALKRHQNLGQCSRLVWEGLFFPVHRNYKSSCGSAYCYSMSKLCLLYKNNIQKN